MTLDRHPRQRASHRGGGWLRSRTGAVFMGFVAIASFFLVAEHSAHVVGVLPLLLILGCLLMHVFMHGRHSGHRGSSGADEGRR